MDDKSTSTDMEISKDENSHAKTTTTTGALLIAKLWGKKIGYRLWRLFAEFSVVLMGVAIAWLYGLSFFLTQQSIDISGAKSNVGLFFADVVAGAGVDIPTMKLDWYPATDDIVFTGQDIIINDKDGNAIQTLSRLKSFFSLSEVQKGQMIPRKLSLSGGVVTWIEDENGRIKAGLGTPETLGRLGPVWEGRRASPVQEGKLDFNGLTSVEIDGASAFYINKYNGLNISLENVSFDFKRRDDNVDFDLSGALLNKETTEQHPLALNVKTNSAFEAFNVAFEFEGVRPSIFGPKMGRYKDLTRIDAPTFVEGDFFFSRISGLTSANVDLRLGKGILKRAETEAPFSVDRFNVVASLDAGDAKMTVKAFDLESRLLAFKGRGAISELGTISDGNINSSPLFDLNFQGVKIDATPNFEAPIDIKAVDLTGRLDMDSRTVTLDKYRIDRGTHSIEGQVFAKENKDGILSLVKADGKMTGTLLPAELLEVWPVKFADGARRWIERSILKGDVDTLSFKSEHGLNSEGKFEELSMEMDYTVSDATVKYISTMTPMTGAAGKARIADNSLVFELDTAKIGDIHILPSRVEIPRLRPKGGDMIITANGTGQASDLLTLINQKPFQYADRYGVDPSTLEGTGQVSLKISRPLLEYFDQNRIKYSASGAFKGINAPFALGPHKFHNGDITFTANAQKLTVSGPVNIGPWRAQFEGVETFDKGTTPTKYHVYGDMESKVYEALGFGHREFFAGKIGMDVRAEGNGINIDRASVFADLSEAEMSFGEYWNKPKGEPGKITASILRDLSGIKFNDLLMEAADLKIKGAVSLNAESALEALSLDEVEIGKVVKGALEIKPSQGRDFFDVIFTGETLDISDIVDNSFSERGSSINIPVSLRAEVETLTLDPLYNVQNAVLIYETNGETVTTLDLNGKAEDGALHVALETDLAAKLRKVDVSLPHAAKAAKAFLEIDGLEGGVFSLEGTLPLSGEVGPSVGRAVIEKFTLKEAPILAKLLSLGSLTGLFDTLSGEGLAFERLELPFQLLEGDLSIRDAQVYGPALGMTGEGQINLTTRSVDMDGALVPAYTANSMFGDIPIIGDIFVGKDGEGVFALNYSVNGPFSATQIAVNPLSALTPGFLRGLFRKKRDELPAMDDAVQDRPVP